MHRVELKEFQASQTTSLLCLFLMHRVELKVIFREGAHLLKVVPNAPCGVESARSASCTTLRIRFLMHRVELKALNCASYKTFLVAFLMHRVELKGPSHGGDCKPTPWFLTHREELRAVCLQRAINPLCRKISVEEEENLNF